MLGDTQREATSTEVTDLRKEAMLRRTSKDGASVTAAAQIYGYTEEEVRRWIERNMPRNRDFAEPE